MANNLIDVFTKYKRMIDTIEDVKNIIPMKD
jgi:hypothetical protein